jgi:hypothetical protein
LGLLSDVSILVPTTTFQCRADFAASIGGYFAEPAKNFPSLFTSSLFAKFPYLLPNLICVAMLVIAIICGYALLDETHPDMQPWSTQEDLDTSTAQTPLLPAQGATANAPANLTTECYGTFETVDMQRDELWRVKSNGELIEDSPSNDKVITRTVLTFVVALGIFTYHSVSCDVLRLALENTLANTFIR